MNRDEVDALTASVFWKLYRGPAAAAGQQCLRWAMATLIALREFGVRGCINAGTAEFQFSEEPEPAINQLSYTWTPGVDVSIFDRLPFLPEIHCWAVIPDGNGGGTLIDPTTGFLPVTCERLGLPWLMPAPPKVLWTTPESLPVGFRYHPYLDACEYASRRAFDALQELGIFPNTRAHWARRMGLEL